MYIIISSGVRELFRAGSGERSAERNENSHGQVQRQHADECTYAQHWLSETGRRAIKHTRIQQRTPSAKSAASAQAARGNAIQQDAAQWHRHNETSASHSGRIQQAPGEYL